METTVTTNVTFYIAKSNEHHDRRRKGLGVSRYTVRAKIYAYDIDTAISAAFLNEQDAEALLTSILNAA